MNGNWMMLGPHDNDFTLDEAIDWVIAWREKGCICPCCGRKNKVYRRNMRDSFIVEMVILYHYHLSKNGSNPDDWEYVHISTIKERTFHRLRELAKCGYEGWELVVSQFNEGTKKRRSGSWKLTRRGEDFLRNLISIHAILWVYKDRVIDRSKRYTTMREALSEHFDYEELMNGHYDPTNP